MVRPATMCDADAVHQLVNYYAEQGLMLHRSLESIYESLRDFLVCCRDGRVVGCVALRLYWRDLAEIRSLAVSREHRGRGIGRELLLGAVQEARNLCLPRVFALTYEPAFFEKFGFRTVDKDALPPKVWRDCIHCPKADACDEVAVILEL
ncbi:MAG: GNAT family N-acetyltransferase [Planctomycetales bacterium 4484_123]|nr:MAG: GNAT family N-acetyltransferase [Planctomycetales bacterium 4484_123]